MALQAPKTSASKFTPQDNLEPGSYPARVARVYGLGTHPQIYQGEAKPSKFLLTVVYELVDAFMTDEDGNELEDKPRWVMEKFPLNPLDSVKSKSTIRYLAIDPQAKLEGDWSKVIGMPVSVTIVNNAGKDGRIFDNVGGTTAMRPRDAAKLPDLVNEGFFFDPSEPNIEYFNKIPKFVQDDIRSAIDFPGSKLEALLNGGVVPPKRAPEPEPEVDDPDVPDMDDDAPWAD